MMDEKRLRAWWAKKQGLDGSLKNASPAEVLEKSGWARSVGGVNPYITLFARAGISREAAEAAIAKSQIHELPSARGCTHVLPASDFALGLKVGQGFGDEAAIHTAVKFLGVTEKEIDTLSDRVLKALGNGSKDPRELKEVIGDAVRNLGEAGKKKGVTTTLPLALGKLQGEGKIRRIPSNGRLDQQRFSYTLWSPSPLEKFRLNAEEAYAELARRYFRWIGPASLAHFRWFSGLRAKVAKSALDSIGAVPVEKDSDLLLLPDELDAFQSFKTPKEPQYSLISSIDGLLLLRRDLAALLEQPDRDRKMMAEKGMVQMGAVQDLSSHAIIDCGRVIGLWEFEPSSGKIAWFSFVKADAKLKAAVDETEKFVSDQLGDARSFSLDSPESRAPRIKALQAK
ncbi:winged helix DNA-binding domain-containing protein [bacterium]|nr:winged helix DNA-binding domain-containing protein [bacterium]